LGVSCEYANINANKRVAIKTSFFMMMFFAKLFLESIILCLAADKTEVKTNLSSLLKTWRRF
jgi:hypothetical protein